MLSLPWAFLTITLSLDVMLENLNNSLFYLINATPDSAQWAISLAIFIAKDLISIVPLLAVPQITHYVLDGFIWRRRTSEQVEQLGTPVEK